MSLLKKILYEIIRFPLLAIWHLQGWNTTRDELEDDKLVLTGAPHTSNWDYYHVLMAMLKFRRKIYITIKGELFFFPLGIILRALGGIPIDRKNSNNLVEELSERIKSSERMVLLFTPDGTRSYRPHWKSGFYWTAYEAGVPVILGVPDYEQKIARVDYRFMPTGDIEADFVKIREHQEKYGVALYPEKTNPVITSQMYEQQKMEEESLTSSLQQDDDLQRAEMSA